MPSARAIVVGLGFLFMGLAAHWTQAADPTRLTIRLLDLDGKPLAGGTVGQYGHGDTRKTPRWTMYPPATESDEHGQATLALRHAEKVVLLYARHEAKGLAAFHEVDESQFGEPIEIALAPACRVFGTLKSSEFDALKQQVSWTNVYLFVGNHRPLTCMGMNQEFEFFVPPGHYKLNAYGHLLNSRDLEIEVPADQKSLDVGAIDLPAEKLATLFGKPAPPLANIKGWRNSDPLSFEALKGKVVVLDFWGYWCGPCVAGMPQLMALHDDYHDRGLVVLGIHDESVADVAEMEKRLDPIRKRQWSGRAIPFPLALDGGGEKQEAGQGATTKSYGIHGFPTGVLIDREGNVVSQFHVDSDEEMKKLHDLLGIAEDPKTFVPSWRKQFDAVYSLAPGEVLKRVAPPFIQAREPFITRRTVSSGSQKHTERLTAVERDPNTALEGSAGRATLGVLLRSLMPYGTPEGACDCPKDLADLEVPGDWTVREPSSLEDRFAALAKILKSDLNLDLAIERRTVPRDVIVASGQLAFKPLPGLSELAGINVASDPANVFEEVGGGSGEIGQFLAWLAGHFERPVVNQVTPQSDAKLRWRQCEVHDYDREAGKLDAVLKLLEQQTALKFDKERRDVAVWFVRKKS